jgi:hypothetical protein
MHREFRVQSCIIQASTRMSSSFKYRAGTSFGIHQNGIPWDHFFKLDTIKAGQNRRLFDIFDNQFIDL